MGVYVLGIAGASGSPYARRVLEQMLGVGHDVKAVITDAGRKVLAVEEDLVLTGNTEADTPTLLEWANAADFAGTFELYHHKDVAAPIASGSFAVDGMVVVPREMPLSLIHLRNMTAVTEAGAIVLPASPGFYHNPKSIDDLVDMVAGRILASLGIDSEVMKTWLGPEPQGYSEEGIQ